MSLRRSSLRGDTAVVVSAVARCSGERVVDDLPEPDQLFAGRRAQLAAQVHCPLRFDLPDDRVGDGADGRAAAGQTDQPWLARVERSFDVTDSGELGDSQRD